MSVYETFDEKKKFACRVIADHARATAFAIADGILPGNEGRNYVLRKIMRRAIYHGRQTLGFDNNFFNKVTNFVIDQMRDAYPELEQQRGFIQKMVSLEEKRFGATLTVGLSKLDEEIDDVELTETKEKPGKRTVRVILNDGREVRPMRSVFDTLDELHIKEAQRQLRWINQQFGGVSQLLKVIENAKEAQKVFEETKRITDAAKEAQRVSEQTKEIRQLIDSIGIDGLKQIDLIRRMARLYDTFGTPRDLIRVVLEERGFAVGEDKFNEAFDVALSELQQPGAHATGVATAKINPIYATIAERAGKSIFKGYETTKVEKCKVVALLKNNVEVESLEEGDEGEVVLDQTPFYAEAGGQVGDVGTLSNVFTMERWLKDPPPSITETLVTVNNTYAPASGLIVHRVKVERSNLWLGDEVTAAVDAEKRDATRRNHTATHLLHAALREVLGTHVKQAGSIVAPNYLRFDFSHYQPLTKEEIVELERLVNQHIIANAPVNTDLMAIEDAMRAGAMALFGEKYGAKVRVLSVGDGGFSRELCGGTHVRATGDIGLMKITSDESIASGTRRIRAVTGADAFALFQESWEREAELATRFRTAPEKVPAMVDKLQEDLKKARKEADELKLKLALGGGAATGGNDVREVAGVKVLVREASGLDVAGVRQLSDNLLNQIKSGVVVIGRAAEGKVSLVVRSSDDVKGRVPAGKVISQLAPIVGGRGGGRPDMAEGGGTQPENLNDALQASYGIIERMLQ